MDKNKNKYLLAKRLEILYGQTRFSLLGNGAAGLFIVILFWGQAEHIVLLSWLAVNITMLIVRTLFAQACAAGRINRSERWCYLAYNAGAAVSGALWAAVAVYLCANETYSYSAIMLITICGLIAAAVAHNSIAFPSFLAYAYPAALPVGIFFLSRHSQEMQFLGTLALLFLVVLTILSYHLNKMIFRYFTNEHEYVDLVQKMQQEKEQIIDLNTDLMNELLKHRVIKETLELENEKIEGLANRLKTLSTTDSLTGIANRRRFDEFLAEEWARASRAHSHLSLILCDIDYFKPYNDYYGHQSGDRCLTEVAALLAEHARRNDDMAARYGGEEFAIILSNTDITDAALIAEQMRHGIERLNLLHQAAPAGNQITASFGVASIIPDNITESSVLIAQADHALYRAKQTGRNMVATAARETVLCN